MARKQKVYYHFTGETLRYGAPIPPLGTWLTFNGKPIPCEQGLHASPTPWDALQYAPGNLLHKVILGGKIVAHGDSIDKYAAQKRKIIATINAEPVLRSFARRVALDVVHLWNSPPVVLSYLNTGDESIRAAAWAAARAAARAAAWAAARAAARDAARAAARDAARDAAWTAARDAARDAAWAAAWTAAEDAAWTAAEAAARAKYQNWFNEMIEQEFAAQKR